MKIGIFLVVALLSSTLVVGLPILQSKYSTRQMQEDYLRKHGYYGTCFHYDADNLRASDTKALDSAKTEEGRPSFEDDIIVPIEVTESEESEDQGPVDSMELLFRKAVLCFQRKSGLPQTGIVNQETRKEMETQSKAASVAAHNRKKRFVTGEKWRKNDLTYYIVNYDVDRRLVTITEEVIRSEIQRAIKAWTDVSGLRVTEKNSTNADIIIGFYSKDHGDDAPFNGEFVAHAYYPQVGDIHMDANQPWSACSDDGIDLFNAVMHEFGHSIGIRHSDTWASIMYPSVVGYDPNRRMSFDDIFAVRSLYGPPQDQTTSSERKPNATALATESTMATGTAMTTDSSK